MARQDKLVPIAEFAHRDRADDAWVRLNDAEIPATVEADPGPFGATPLTRIYVARRHVDAAQTLIADLVVGP